MFYYSTTTMTDVDIQITPDYLGDDVVEAASALLQLKTSAWGREHASSCSDKLQNNADGVCYVSNGFPKNLAWTFLFDRIKDDLSSIECIVLEKLQLSYEFVKIRTISEIFKEVELCTANGYLVIQHGVTASCNQFRNLLQLTFKGKFESREKLVAYERICLEVMYNIN